MAAKLTSLRTREYGLITLAFASFLLLEMESSSRDKSCDKSLPDSFEFYYENDVVLEFEKFGFSCTLNMSERVRCINGTMINSTRTVVNGKVWGKEEHSVKLSVALETDQDSMPRINGKNSGPKLMISRIMEAGKRPDFEMLSCEEMERLFRPDGNMKEFRLNNGITETHGILHHPVIGPTPSILKNVTNIGKPYQSLIKEREKRLFLGTTTRATSRMLGDCFRPNHLSIIVEIDETATALCEDENIANYAQTKCFNNEKLKTLIDESTDKTRAAFVFIKEILCLFAEMENKQFFVQDIHGKHISVSKNFSVRFDSVKNLVHHGSRNILSGSTCKYDEHCPAPSGQLWANGSANRIIYEKCNDPAPLCSDTSCVGYNSSLHMCGISRWLIQPLYSYFERLQDRSRMTSIIMSNMNSWPFLRRPATESCAKATVFLGLYDKDLKVAQQQSKPKNSFHVGPPIRKKA